MNDTNREGAARHILWLSLFLFAWPVLCSHVMALRYASSGVSANLQAIDDAITCTQDGDCDLAPGNTWTSDTVITSNVKAKTAGGMFIRDRDGNSRIGVGSIGIYHYSVPTYIHGGVFGATSTSPVPMLQGSTPVAVTRTISGGAIANLGLGDKIYVTVGTEAGAANDDLWTITGTCVPGQTAIMVIPSAAQITTWKDRTGGAENLLLAGDWTPTGPEDTIVLECYSAAGFWGESSRSNN